MKTIKIQIQLVILMALLLGGALIADVMVSDKQIVNDDKNTVAAVITDNKIKLKEEQAKKIVQASSKTSTARVRNSQKAVVNKPAKRLPTIGKNTVKENIIKYSVDMDVDPAIALAIAKIESNFDHSKRSRHGAVGVFQILPATAKSMGYNAYAPTENIKSGITYYKRLYQKFGNVDLALAAYNAGPGSVKRYNGVPPYAETKRFIHKIKTEYENQKNEPLLEKYQNKEI